MNIGTFEDLAVRDTSDLERLSAILRDRINQARRNKRESVDLETDLCYVGRELEVRANRAKFNANRLGAPSRSQDSV